MSSLSLSGGFLTSVCPRQPHHTPSPSSSRRRLPATISCASKDDNNNNNESNGLVVDRRGVLLGLGGLYGSAANMALGAPLVPPDYKTCHKATYPDLSDQYLECCPPPKFVEQTMNIKDYTFPKTPLRVRRAAQNVANDTEYLDKYNKALDMMKNLPEDHPWNFIQQAKVHCRNCNDGLYQTGFVEQKVNLEVHNSYIFPPWHRYYLHFYERILGNLIGDDTFALPYWNWDAPDGMTFPQFYRYPKSPLNDTYRNPTHIPPDPNKPSAIVDYLQSGGTAPDGQALIDANVAQIRSAFRESRAIAALFMGDPITAGETVAASDTTGAGFLEIIHNSVHAWIGTAEPPYRDMGNFATAARDPVFYTHHANVDRLWGLFHRLRGNQPEFNSPDWLESSFAFYDENQELVKVKVKDCLDPNKLCYTYEAVDLPWLGKVTPRKKAAAEATPKTPTKLVPVSEFGPAPRDLDSTLRVLVPRPKTNRSSKEKEDELEVLVTTGIQANNPDRAWFDVFIAKPYNGNQAGPDLGQYVGSFIRLSHSMSPAGPGQPGKKRSLKLGITYTIEEIGADDVANLVVSFKPRVGKVTVGGVQIKLLATDAKFT